MSGPRLSEVWIASIEGYDDSSIEGVHLSREGAMKWLRARLPEEIHNASEQNKWQKTRKNPGFEWEVGEIDEMDDKAFFDTELGMYWIRRWDVSL